VIDFASLFWFAAYGVAFLTIGLVLRLAARWSGGTSVAEAFGGGYRDAPWPRGVQEEEPVRWDVQRLRRPARAVSREAVPGEAPASGAARTSIGHLDQICR
jgi:hypothetical protein